MSESLGEFLTWLDSFLNFEKLPQKNMFWLDTMECLCSALDNPQNAVPSYHVAGSKGKGSVCAMISSVLTESGKKTGVYASPHIEDFRERIRLNDRFFPDDVYEKAAAELKEKFSSIQNKLPQSRSVTWFELVTVFAFLCMKYARVDEAVYEVGLGGRLDATNVITPRISVINTIELEHTEFLGGTLEKIAAEKAGIIKTGIPVLSAGQTPGVKRVFREKAAEKNTEVIFADEIKKTVRFDYESGHGEKYMRVELDSDFFSRPLSFKTKMFGAVQAENALLASVAVKLVHPEICEETIENGLSKTLLPARFEIIQNPLETDADKNDIVIDGAHTVKSIQSALETFSAVYKTKKAHLLFACAADKDVGHIARLFSRRFEKTTLTVPGKTKASSPEKMKAAFESSDIRFDFFDDSEAGILHAASHAQKDGAVLFVTGSFYLAAELKKTLNGIKSS